jgi:hypothetical protein
MKICIVCGTSHNKKSNAAKYCHYCATDIWKKQTRASARLLQNERRKNNPRQTKGYRLKYRFGIDMADYDALLEKQGGVCAVCKQEDPVKGRALAVDHNHKTGKVRGLLCSKCNKGIGLFKESPELIEKAIKYLEDWQKKLSQITPY